MPNEPPPDRGNISQRGREAIHAALEKIAEHTDLDDDQSRAVVVGLIHAYMEGARAAAAEVTAQAIEQGANVHLNLSIAGTDLTPDDIEL